MDFRLIGILTLAAVSGVWAQDAAQAPQPTPPFVAKVPDQADWKITVKYLPDASDAAAPRNAYRVVEVHTTKIDGIKRDQIHYANETTSEQWSVGNMILWQMPSGAIGMTDSTLQPDPDTKGDVGFPVAADSFPGVSWVRSEFFEHLVVFEQRKCFHYVNGPTEAWIDPATRYPMAYKSGNGFYRYQYSAVPNETLTLPPAYQSVYDGFKKDQEHRRRVEEFLRQGK